MILGGFADKIFEVSDKRINTPKDIQRDESARWANHDVIGKKPLSEFVGPALGVAKFRIALRSQFGVDPKKEMDGWLDMCRRGEVGTLIIGTAIGVDKWRLTNVSQMWNVVSKEGKVVSGEVDLSFEEYVSGVW